MLLISNQVHPLEQTQIYTENTNCSSYESLDQIVTRVDSVHYSCKRSDFVR